MKRVVEIDTTVPIPIGRPRSWSGDLAIKMRAGESVLFQTEQEASKLKDSIRHYHGNQAATMRKVPRIGWRVWRKK
tara:strand:+ start:647 stop:874 length:228 start_codon:yes stop_codon:yes gene_type:complete